MAYTCGCIAKPTLASRLIQSQVPVTISQSPRWPPDPPHLSLLLYCASSQVVAVHRFLSFQTPLYSLYNSKAPPAPHDSLPCSSLLCSLLLQMPLAMLTLLQLLSTLDISRCFSLSSTIKTSPFPNPGAAILVASFLCPHLHAAYI